MSQIQIYGFAGSTYVRTARMTCEEKGVGHELTPVEYGEDSHAELHPFRRMPAARIGELQLFEALAISSYIDRVFNGPSLQPSEPGEHALMLQWISAANDYLYPDLVRALLRDGDRTEEEAVAVRSHLSILDHALSDRSHLAGERLTLGDLFCLPMVAFSVQALDGFGVDEGLGAVGAWLERMRARPSFAATAS